MQLLAKIMVSAQKKFDHMPIAKQKTTEMSVVLSFRSVQIKVLLRYRRYTICHTNNARHLRYVVCIPCRFRRP